MADGMFTPLAGQFSGGLGEALRAWYDAVAKSWENADSRPLQLARETDGALAAFEGKYQQMVRAYDARAEGARLDAWELQVDMLIRGL